MDVARCLIIEISSFPVIMQHINGMMISRYIQHGLYTSTLDVSNDKTTSLLVLDNNNDLTEPFKYQRLFFFFDYQLKLSTTNVPLDNSVIDVTNQLVKFNIIP